MKETTQSLVSEAAKYGIAIFVMACVIAICIFAITVMWKRIVKQEGVIEELVRENIEAYRDLREAINLLSQKL